MTSWQPLQHGCTCLMLLVPRDTRAHQAGEGCILQVSMSRAISSVRLCGRPPSDSHNRAALIGRHSMHKQAKHIARTQQVYTARWAAEVHTCWRGAWAGRSEQAQTSWGLAEGCPLASRSGPPPCCCAQPSGSAIAQAHCQDQHPAPRERCNHHHSSHKTSRGRTSSCSMRLRRCAVSSCGMPFGCMVVVTGMDAILQ